jgi:hypothetical protein
LGRRTCGGSSRYYVAAIEGTFGSVHDFYFDDDVWVVRYLIVDTGKWLPGRLVLISPISIGRPDWVSRQLHVGLTREQIKNSPPIETHKPASRTEEARHLRYYGYAPYWGSAGMWGATAYPGALATAAPPTPTATEADDEEYLRSCGEVAGYHLHAKDGELGHVDDFLFDDLSWAIRYLVIDTSNWWIGKRVLGPSTIPSSTSIGSGRPTTTRIIAAIRTGCPRTERGRSSRAYCARRS